MASIVSAPGDLVIAASDGIDIRFAGIRVDIDLPPHIDSPSSGRGIRISLEGVRGSETRQRDVRFEAARLAWVEGRKAHESGGAEDPPRMPGALVLDRVGVRVTDDIGTQYRWAGGQVAGDGTDWEASWFHSPTPPEAAQTLHLSFTLDGQPTGKECRVRLQ